MQLYPNRSYAVSQYTFSHLFNSPFRLLFLPYLYEHLQDQQKNVISYRIGDQRNSYRSYGQYTLLIETYRRYGLSLDVLRSKLFDLRSTINERRSSRLNKEV